LRCPIYLQLKMVLSDVTNMMEACKVEEAEDGSCAHNVAQADAVVDGSCAPPNTPKLPLPAFTQKAAIGEEKLALFRDIVKEMSPGYDGILPLALELELRKSFNLVGITYSELWYKLVRKAAPLSYIQLRADNPYGQDISAITQTTDKRETCVLFILGRSNEPLLTFEFCHQI